MNFTFNTLFDQCPKLLQSRISALKDVPQRSDFHPEGNVLNHTKIVVNRLSKFRDATLSWAGMFHDIGKDETTKLSEKGYLQAIDHEKVSAELVAQNGLFLIHQGVEPDYVHEIVLNHMRIKTIEEMKLSKQMNMRRLHTFGLLQLFRIADDMSTLTDKELESIGV